MPTELSFTVEEEEEVLLSLWLRCRSYSPRKHFPPRVMTQEKGKHRERKRGEFTDQNNRWACSGSLLEKESGGLGLGSQMNSVFGNGSPCFVTVGESSIPFWGGKTSKILNSLCTLFRFQDGKILVQASFGTLPIPLTAHSLVNFTSGRVNFKNHSRNW